MVIARRMVWIVVALSMAACTLTAPDDVGGPTPMANVPTGSAPDSVLTPDALRIDSATPTPTPDATTCRATTDAPLAVRAEPDLFAAEVTILGAGTSADVVGRLADNSWLRITAAGAAGWVDTSAVTLAGDCLTVPTLATPTPAATATPSVPTANITVALNVRAGASIRFSPPIGRFQPGDTAQILAVNPSGDWYKVLYNGTQGWVYNSPDYLTTSGNLAGLTIEAGPATPTPTHTPIPATPTPTLDPNINYLQDPSFEGAYTGRGSADFNIPQAWQARYEEAPRQYDWQNLRPVAFPHINPPEIQDGGQSLNFTRDYGTFTVTVYQQATVPQGVPLLASAWSWVHTCDPQPAICNSETGSNARVRIGIDPNGGTDPFGSSVTWSGYIAPHDRWEQVSIGATSNTTAVTVFLNATQDTPKGLNRLYWDSAGLFVRP